jgi:hypothetical protein
MFAEIRAADSRTAPDPSSQRDGGAFAVGELAPVVSTPKGFCAANEEKTGTSSFDLYFEALWFAGSSAPDKHLRRRAREEDSDLRHSAGPARDSGSGSTVGVRPVLGDLAPLDYFRRTLGLRIRRKRSRFLAVSERNPASS